MMNEIDQSQNMLPVGTVLRERYRIDRYLASGGFGNTYQATDVHLEEPVAIKEFFMSSISHRNTQNMEVSVSNPANRPSFDSQLRKFRVEARRVRKLKNEHIVRVHDLFDAFGTSYYVMDYIDGESLSARLKRRGTPFDEGEVRGFLYQMLDALDITHGQHIWHLDIKPGNMMLTSDGTLKLIDFGASKLIDQSGEWSTSSQMAYTPGYAPIEQMDQLIDAIGAHTDIYALGASLYNLLTCQSPPRGSLLNDIGDEAFQFGNNVSPQMRRLISYMMQPLRRNRAQNVADVRRFIAANHLEPPITPIEKQPEVVIVSDSLHAPQSPKVGAIPSQPPVSRPPVSQTPAHKLQAPQQPVSQPHATPLKGREGKGRVGKEVQQRPVAQVTTPQSPITQRTVSQPPLHQKTISQQKPVANAKGVKGEVKTINKQDKGNKGRMSRLTIGIGVAMAIVLLYGIIVGINGFDDSVMPTTPGPVVNSATTKPATTTSPVNSSSSTTGKSTEMTADKQRGSSTMRQPSAATTRSTSSTRSSSTTRQPSSSTTRQPSRSYEPEAPAEPAPAYEPSTKRQRKKVSPNDVNNGQSGSQSSTSRRKVSPDDL